ncbi:N-acetylmuramidase domain-containing protein [Flavobacterium microcysteis]
MKTIRLGTKSAEVNYLNELLQKIGHPILVSNYFSPETDIAVRDFQSNHSLVVDGVVGIKTWSKLLEIADVGYASNYKLLSEQDLIDFANFHNLELAIVKAVNEVESGGKGFLVDGRPKILFEGHVFWRELERRNINCSNYVSNDTQTILYQNYTKKYYVSGKGEYDRLEKAADLNPDTLFREAAYSSASWGLYQIMGFNAPSLGYASIDEFVEKMYQNEGEHLKAFGLFLEQNNLIRVLKNKNWAEFALRYNGKGYKTNRYDEKLMKAYAKYAA